MKINFKMLYYKKAKLKKMKLTQKQPANLTYEINMLFTTKRTTITNYHV